MNFSTHLKDKKMRRFKEVMCCLMVTKLERTLFTASAPPTLPIYNLHMCISLIRLKSYFWFILLLREFKCNTTNQLSVSFVLSELMSFLRSHCLFSSESFIVLTLIFRTLINFLVNFCMWCEVKDPTSFFCLWVSSCPIHP